MTPYSLTPLHDRVILVTGAARRVGSAIVRIIGEHGAAAAAPLRDYAAAMKSALSPEGRP